MKKIILRLEGGLGNQLFQYAFARALQEKSGGIIIFDLHTFKKDIQRKLSLHHFELNNNVYQYPGIRWKVIFIIMQILGRIIKKVSHLLFKNHRAKQIKLMTSLGFYLQENSIFEKFSYISKTNLKYISGNWMSEKFFSPVANQLIIEFSVKTPPSNVNAEMAARLNRNESVCVHIRRGDYAHAEWADKLLICDFNYYENAIKRMKELVKDPVFYVFSNTSDDIAWIKDNYKFSSPVNFVDLNNPDYEEFRLMSNCHHFILSNSSFSWWASYISGYDQKIVIAPSKWNSGIWDVRDIYLPYWEIIHID